MTIVHLDSYLIISEIHVCMYSFDIVIIDINHYHLHIIDNKRNACMYVHMFKFVCHNLLNAGKLHFHASIGASVL